MLKRFFQPRLPLVIGLVAVLVVLFLGWRYFFQKSSTDERFVIYQVSKTTLPIVITERGNLESQIATDIRCQVENVSSNRNQSGTQILSIVPNGAAVKEGDLLVELDSSPIRELLDQQTIQYERTKAEQIQAKSVYENQITQNETAIADADLQIKLSSLELEAFVDKENGTHKLNVDQIKREIDEINSNILEAQAALELRRNELEGVEALFELGYKGRSDLESTRLSFLQAEGNLANALNQLETKQATLNKLNAYDEKMQRLTLEGALANAERAREQVEIDNLSQLTQAEAALDAANRALAKEKERLDKLQTQLENCKIYAPHDGMVVYERDRDFTVEEGAVVRERQEILSLPNLAKMQVRTYVHESVLDQVEQGQEVDVRVDAFADRVYRGVVESVAVVPAYRGWSGGNVKTYETVIRIDQEVKQLKPGMTAVVDIKVQQLEDVIAVPVQAVVQRKHKSWVYVSTTRGVEQRMIELGPTNDKFVQVVSGLEEGDDVILNPMAILGSEDEDEEGSDGDSEGSDGAPKDAADSLAKNSP